jgi:hypothetical protein
MNASAIIIPKRDLFGRKRCGCPCHSRPVRDSQPATRNLSPIRSRHPRVPMSWGLRSLVDRVRPETLNGTGLMIRPNGDPSGHSGLLISPAHGLSVTSTGTCTNCGCGGGTCAGCPTGTVPSVLSAVFTGVTICNGCYTDASPLNGSVNISGPTSLGTYSLPFLSALSSSSVCIWGTFNTTWSAVIYNANGCSGSVVTTYTGISIWCEFQASFGRFQTFASFTTGATYTVNAGVFQSPSAFLACPTSSFSNSASNVYSSACSLLPGTTTFGNGGSVTVTA